MQIRGRQSSQVVLVEDDEQRAGEILSAFDNEDLTADRVSPEALLGRPPGLFVIVMNRSYGGRDSLHIVERMRALGDGTPIILISKFDSVEERINGLRSGADDYLTMPFAIEELVARVSAALRRYESRRRTVLTVGPLMLDRVERTVRRDGRPIDLLPREFQLLLYLMQNAGSVVSRRALLEHVWNVRGSTATNVIDVNIGKLRRKIRGYDDEPMITNVRGIGFRLEAPDVFWTDPAYASQPRARA